MEFVYTDVLVIGGGIAGLRAAIAAREKGADVLLMARRKAGKSGCSLVANTGHRVYSPGQPPESDMIVQTLRSGQGLAQEELVRIMAEGSIDAIKELQQWGCPINFDYVDGVPVYARCPERKGMLITEVLREQAEAVGVEFWDGYLAIQLVKASERVIGAFAEQDGELYCFLAKSVVLAAGGVGQIYHPTDNPVDITGDALALAWRAGAQLMDLEFVQYYPYQLKHPVSLDLHSSLFEAGAHLINEQGDRFMEDYPEEELVTRDVLSREMFLQQGPIFLDLMEVDLDRLKALHPRLLDFYLEDHELLVSPIQHFFMGGVRMDAQGHSTIPGLFVCGEAAAGVHGANRLGGNALTECQVFGRIAGRTAGEEALQLDLVFEDLDQQKIEAQLYIPNLGDDYYLVNRTTLGHLMWDAVGIVRDGEGLYRAIREIKLERNRLEQSKPRSIAEWYQTHGMLTVANLIAETANYRTESRGAHYRLDFPETDPEWDGHLIVEGDEIFFE